MEKSFYMLSEENSWFPLGCIFEMTAQQKLFCLDNNQLCENKNKVFDNCVAIDRKSALLLQAVQLGNRVQLYNDGTWKDLMQLDVGDDCFYLMTGHEMPCKIVSKQLTDKGISFTISMESGKRCNLNIDRLRIVKMSLSQSIPTVKNRISNWTIRSSISYDRPVVKDTVSKCKCLSNILQKAHALELSLKEKESLFRHLFSILPDLPDDDEGRCSLHWACYYLLSDSVTALLNTNDGKNKQDKQGNVPLYLAINSPLAETKDLQSIRSLERIVISLITHGADINIRNNQKETPLMKVFKNGNFSVFGTLLENYPHQFRLSDHLLSEKASILELLIKLKKYNLSSQCCKKCANDKDQNEYFIKSAQLSLSSGAKDLCIEILEKSFDVDESFLDGETFLTHVLKDTFISTENVCAVISSISFKFDKCNHVLEHPLSLACRRLLLDVAKVMFSKSFYGVTKLNDALEETINAYNEYYINITYKSMKIQEFQSITQIKQISIALLDLLMKNGANIESAKPSVLNSIENCVDVDFVKVIRHLCRAPTTIAQNSPIPKRSFCPLTQSSNQCSICLDRNINCSFGCGHTCCFICGNQISLCHACREPITERRKLFIS